MNDMMIGVDLAKSVFQVHGALRTGEVQFRKSLTRKQFPAFMARQDPCLIIFETCGGSHYWAREIKALGHEVKLIGPQYVRPFVKRQKNDGGTWPWPPRRLSSSPARLCSAAGNDWFISALRM